VSAPTSAVGGIVGREIRVVFSDEEYEFVNKVKSRAGLTWRDFIVELAKNSGENIDLIRDVEKINELFYMLEAKHSDIRDLIEIMRVSLINLVKGEKNRSAKLLIEVVNRMLGVRKE